MNVKLVKGEIMKDVKEVSEQEAYDKMHTQDGRKNKDTQKL